jgi:uncharacterized protein (UPF0297 family)
MNRYIVIRRPSIEELESAVNAYVTQKGYEPQGGIFGVMTSSDPAEILWCQALWKRVIDIL